MSNIHGNIKTLFSMHGDVNVDKAIDAIEYMTELKDIDINEINDASEKGLLYITTNGKILEIADKPCEGRAKYKLVPTGLKLRYTNYPLFASFIKIGGFWEGAFIGTGIQLFEMYKEHFGGNKQDYSKDYETIFGGVNRTMDIRGFGLDEVLKNYSGNDNQTVYNDTSSNEHINELAKALEKCKNQMKSTPNKKGSRNNKMQRKAARLEAHLNKLRGTKNKAVTKNIIRKAPLKDRYDSIDEVEWMEVQELGTVLEFFEDKATKELHQRIADGISVEEGNSVINEIKQKLDEETHVEYENIDNISGIVTTEVELFEDTVDKEIEVSALVTEEVIILDDTDSQTDHTPSLAKAITEAIYDGLKDKEEQEGEEVREEVREEVVGEVVGESFFVEETQEISLSVLKSMDHDSTEYDSAEKNKYKIQLKADLICDIYERLLIKENWKFKDKNRLGFYLKGLFIIIDRNRKNNPGAIKGNGYTLSKDHMKQVINTGLIDIYGNDIMLVDHTPQVDDFYNKKIVVMSNKAVLVDWGFDIRDIRKLPAPVKIVNNPVEFIFRASLDDIDLNDEHHLKHIIEERRYRFPGKYKNTSVKTLCDKLKCSVEQAVRLSKRDYKYIVPKYDFERNAIQFLIPFHLDTKLDEIPELVIVVGNYEGIWQVYTVLYTDDAYDDARLICKPCSDWLRLK